MTVRELYTFSERYGLLDDEVDKVSDMTRTLPKESDKRPALCGFCEKRKTDRCAWPKLCDPAMAGCLEFETRK